MDIDREIRLLEESLVMLWPFRKYGSSAFTLIHLINYGINQGIANGTANPFDVPHANRRLADIERRCKVRAILRLEEEKNEPTKPHRVITLDEARLLKRKPHSRGRVITLDELKALLLKRK